MTSTWYFRHAPDASEIGRLGAQSLKTKRRAPIRKLCDELREQLGMEPVEWGRL
jgi:hypothetical protein